jgi:hypothetical protein
MSTQAPIDVAKLPPASSYMNYPHQGPPVGKYLGPNTMGEYFTVVSREVDDGMTELIANGTVQALIQEGPYRVRVGLAVGCYLINGVPTDPDGLPAQVAVAKMQRDWQALKTPRKTITPGR